MGKPVSAVVISTRRCSTTVHILTEADCHDRPLLLQFSLPVIQAKNPALLFSEFQSRSGRLRSWRAGSLRESTDRIDAIHQLLVKSNLRKVNSKVLFEEDYNLYRINRLQTPAEKQRVLVRERLRVAICDKQIANKLANIGFFFHALSLEADEKQARKILQILDERIAAFIGNKDVQQAVKQSNSDCRQNVPSNDGIRFGAVLSKL